SDPESTKPIVPGAGAFGSVAWTPAGELLYSVGLNGETNIWTMAPDGGHPRQLTKGSRVNTMPTMSRDGRYIVFVSTRSGDTGLWRMDADGANPVQLTKEYAWSPSISPDGEWVVYAGYAKGLPVVLRVPLEGGGSERVTDP